MHSLGCLDHICRQIELQRHCAEDLVLADESIIIIEKSTAILQKMRFTSKTNLFLRAKKIQELYKKLR
jgi:hypothetical protein